MGHAVRDGAHVKSVLINEGAHFCLNSSNPLGVFRRGQGFQYVFGVAQKGNSVDRVLVFGRTHVGFETFYEGGSDEMLPGYQVVHVLASAGASLSVNHLATVEGRGRWALSRRGHVPRWGMLRRLDANHREGYQLPCALVCSRSGVRREGHQRLCALVGARVVGERC
jgi:hypothetical protein